MESLNEKELTAFVSNSADVDLKDPKNIKKLQYDSNRYLAVRIAHLMDIAVTEKTYIHVICYKLEFHLDPFKNVIGTRAKASRLRSLSAVPLSDSEVSYSKTWQGPEDVEAVDVKEPAMRTIPYESFIWQVAILGARGRLPKEVPLEQEYRLTRWPNLTRLQTFPHVVQLSATWASSPFSISEVIEKFSIPQKHVFTFFIATYTLGYMNSVQNATIGSQTAPQLPHKHRGVLRRLLQSLYGGRD